MDPDENRRRQLAIARFLVNSDAGQASELAELVLDLDKWIRNGGFLPAQWAKGKQTDQYAELVSLANSPKGDPDA